MSDRLGPYELNTIVTGDARELAKAIPDESVDLIFTDPVYDRIDDYRWLAETAARVLKPDRACLVWCGIEYLPDVLGIMCNYLDFKWLFTVHQVGVTVGRFIGKLKCKQSPCLVFRAMPINYVWDVSIVALNGGQWGSSHKWSKDPLTAQRWIQAFTRPGDIVADFFCGGGTVPAVAKMLGVNYWACEIDPATAARARERVAMTQPPLFVMPQPEQAVMSL